MKSIKFFTIISTIAIGIFVAMQISVFAQTDASVTPSTPPYDGPNYDHSLWVISYNKAIIPVSLTSYHCSTAALVAEYATWADYTKIDWHTGVTGKYTGFIPVSSVILDQNAPKTTINITLPSLSPSTSYIFRVGAKCISSSPMGTLAYTTSANQFSTPAAPSSPIQSGDVTPPNAPDNLQVKDVTSTHMALSWNTPTDDVGVTRYELKYKTGGGVFVEGDWVLAPALPAPGAPPPGTMGVATFGYNELTPSTTYILGLKAYDAAGNSSPLAVSPSFTTLDPSPPSIPLPPTGLAASFSTVPNGPEIQLNVNDNALNETEYRLYWRLSGTTWSSIFQPTGTSTWSFPANIGNIQIAAPTIAGTYEYQIQACNSLGCSSYSNIASVQVPVTVVPIAPTNLRLDPTPSANAIFLKWNDNSSEEDVFNIDRKFVSDANYAGTLHWAQLSANTTSFSDTNVVPGQHYDYRVHACNSVGCSSYASFSDAVVTPVAHGSTTLANSSRCTGLNFTLKDNKTTYDVGDIVNYSYSCIPAGTNAASVTIQVVKPDGTPITYVTGSNVGAVLQQMGFSTSNLVAGSYVLKACLNSTSCETGSVYPISFTIIGTATIILPVLPPFSSAPTQSSPSNQPITQPSIGNTLPTGTPSSTPLAPATDLSASPAASVQQTPDVVPRPLISTPPLSALEECFRNVLGEVRYKQVHTNAAKPTNEELEKTKPCFKLTIITQIPSDQTSVGQSSTQKSIFTVPGLNNTTKSVVAQPQFADTCETRQLPDIKSGLHQLRKKLHSINVETLRLRKANVFIPTEFDLLYEDARNLIKQVDGAKTCENAYLSGIELPDVINQLAASLIKIEKLRFARKALNSLDVTTKSFVNLTVASLNRLGKQKFDVIELKDRLNSQKAEIASCRADAESLLKDNEPELFEGTIRSCFDILDSISSLKDLVNALIDARRFLNNKVTSLINSSIQLVKKFDKEKENTGDLKDSMNALKKRRDEVFKNLNNLKLNNEKLLDEVNSVIILASDLVDTMNELQGVSSFDQLVEKPPVIAAPKFSKALTSFFK
ncbi:fibronectin type III domain-containing protein [Candidatus Uhrbacteria bacterium]|nr:fibronectin type III domain-containing protein [Candidatus Uhrbacteria bacterium]